jgi:hypothetical protein
MTTSRKQREVAISQCRSVEKLAEIVDKINGVSVGTSGKLRAIQCKMREARHSICDEDEVTTEIPLLRPCELE